jgi:DNA-binding GntR family transcriptional regulator
MEHDAEVMQPVTTQATPAVIADQLRRRIVDGTFPPGSQIIEGQLSAQLRVSRGPIREALQRLIQEGLLVSIRNRGVFVVRLGPSDVAEIYGARKAIERFAASELARTGGDSYLLELDSLISRMDDAARASDRSQLARCDLAFHETLVAGTNNRRLSRMFATLLAETQLCLANLGDTYTNLGDLVDEHRHLVAVIRSRKPAAASRAVDEHLASAVVALSRTRTDPQDGVGSPVAPDTAAT